MKLDLERLAMELHEARMQAAKPKETAHYVSRWEREPRCWRCGTRYPKGREVCACEERDA